MAKEVTTPLDVFANIPTRKLPDERVDKIREDYRKGRFDQVFPSGSSGRPALLVGRRRQMAQLSVLARQLLDKHPLAQRTLLGVVLHGPRGTGKTALLDAFADGVQGAGGHVVDWIGNDALLSRADLIGSLADRLPPIPEESETIKGEGRVGVNFIGAKAAVRGASELRTTWPGGSPSLSTVEGALRALVERGGGGKESLLILIDEAHGADPATLGSLLNAVQKLNRPGIGLPVAIALAGTPDVLDVLGHPDCKATWFLDRAGADERLAAMPNDLRADDCFRAIKATLAATGVKIEDDSALKLAVEGCKGSPYFLQALGKAALASASQNEDMADFSPGAEIDLAFRRTVLARYERVWADLDRQGLSGCARQLGALWRARGSADSGGRVTEGLMNPAIRSGLARAPDNLGVGVPVSARDAKAHFKHLGLLWSVGGGPSGPWSLGLPSFFDYVESMFHDPANSAHYSALPQLVDDMEGILGQAAQSSPEARSDPMPSIA